MKAWVDLLVDKMADSVAAGATKTANLDRDKVGERTRATKDRRLVLKDCPDKTPSDNTVKKITPIIRDKVNSKTNNKTMSTLIIRKERPKEVVSTIAIDQSLTVKKMV